MEKRGLLPCIVLLLILPLLYTKTFCCLSLAQPHTSSSSHTHSGLHKLTQHGCMGSRIECVLSQCTLMVRQHEIWLSLEVGVLVCYTPTSSSSLLSSILRGSTLLWGPIRPLYRSMPCGSPGSRVIQSTPYSLMQDFHGYNEGKMFKYPLSVAFHVVSQPVALFSVTLHSLTTHHSHI